MEHVTEKITITYEFWWEVTLLVDPTKIDKFKEQILLYMNGSERIENENGDIKKAFLKMLVIELIEMSMHFNQKGIEKEFENKEGWYPLTIDNGVKIIDIDSFRFDEDELSFEQEEYDGN